MGISENTLRKLEQMEREALQKGDSEKITFCVMCREPLSKSEIAMIFRGETKDNMGDWDAYLAFQLCAKCRETFLKNIREGGFTHGVVGE